MRLSSYRDSIPDRPAVRPAAGNRGGWGGPRPTRGHRSECRRSLCRAVVFLVCVVRGCLACVARAIRLVAGEQLPHILIRHLPPSNLCVFGARNTWVLCFPTVRLAAPWGRGKWLSPGQTGGMTAPGRRRCGERVRNPWRNAGFEARYPNQPGRVQECFGVSDRRRADSCRYSTRRLPGSILVSERQRG